MWVCKKFKKFCLNSELARVEIAEKKSRKEKADLKDNPVKLLKEVVKEAATDAVREMFPNNTFHTSLALPILFFQREGGLWSVLEKKSGHLRIT